MLPTSLNRVKFSCLLIAVVWLASGCSTGQMVVRGTQSILDSGIIAMNRETDLELAEGAMPANLKLLEGMLIEDPGNTRLHIYAAEGFYAYTFGFVELQDSHRAQHLYRRCYEHARVALQQSGVTLDPETSTPAEFEAAVGKAGRKAVPAMFWTASCLANWVNLNRDSPAGIAELASAATLMQRVIALDDTFYYGGPHLFFGVYYGGRSPLFGGDFRLSEEHFRRAAEINNDKLLLVYVLQAEYLDRQRLDRDAFHRHLTRVIEAPDNLSPDMALMNAVAKQQAAQLIKSEDDWF
jgi:TRAP transporter T-component